ncbi:hypothetical protein CERSUDRAFT_119504 [Gelatoporia subvermispora B]|uniref:Uncharacterized protein n=1 Tax=Ceriporiopsis subvermispora (strain B) TaxID=914234 RepID=M2R096_CERS8|nr:hypothetical protein CERSUDRAFT_119504 [Gelatoporia subvermispora B]
MVELATPIFLEQLKAAYPSNTVLAGSDIVLSNPWYLVAAVAFSTSNGPEAIPIVIHSLLALNAVMPDELREKQVLRDTNPHMPDFDKSGRDLFLAMYRDTGDSVQNLLDTAYPDLGWWCNTIGYGVAYGGTGVLSQVSRCLCVHLAQLGLVSSHYKTEHHPVLLRVYLGHFFCAATSGKCCLCFGATFPSLG